ncbi:uncharacterized protein K460DRAFT_418247 [Cucurbitaria berberidis CBS 394.84]|uniref:DUF7918 domain-containing protein n=1 Tax=Cucurbitaria berberidis CBS 394.84 TaxID=1168544 RepID=A0A9P4L6B5_9PLEO|nr:uncharacterized protein K460DRAFT_418247 [Cucurbitaria berberidis CBS 394.84]KAF1843124.1 hypothetical protein K460DRAFT_418247 [Cucurbitaria berberidis CBS 394.84]
MPNYRSINIALHSQFDVETLPEYYPAPKDSYIARGITGFVPELINNDTSTCSVYMPALPGSTFWIGYSVSPPVPAGHYFLFKLYINGKHIVSWSTGKENNWRGKTMFGLYERPEDEEGKRRVEKRVLRFTPPDRKDKKWKDVTDVFDENACIEIKVHRAHGRKRIERELEEYKKTQHAKKGKGVDLVNAGRAGPYQPKRFYKFALIDPVDQPFATFRYYYRTWTQIRELGLLDEECNGAGEENDLSVIEPNEASYRGVEEDRRSHVSSRDFDEGFRDCNNGAGGEECSGDGHGDNRTDVSKWSPSRPLTPGCRASDTSEQPYTYVPRGAPDSKTNAIDELLNHQAHQRISCAHTPPRFYRLSVPPSVKLDPPELASRRLPPIPRKSESSSSIAYRPHPAYPDPVGDWTIPTPSPVKPLRDCVSTPPMKPHKDHGRFASSWINIMSSTWKRCGTQGSGGSNDTNSREGARSVP